MDSATLDPGSARLRGHSIHIDARERITITGVNDVVSFNEQEVELITDAGELRIEGDGLHITRLTLEDGVVSVEGSIAALEYGETEINRGSLLSRLFR